MHLKGRVFIGLVLLLFGAGCSSAPPDSFARDAFAAWARQNGFSYQNLALGSSQRDGQIVQVPVIAELRKTNTEPWVEQQAREDCRPEGSVWHCEQAINPVPTARGAATATAIAVASAEAQVKNLHDMGWITFTSSRAGNEDIFVM
ncbi:MAG: hypothetical protein ACM3JD_00250, partial [Rudaea sp.]